MPHLVEVTRKTPAGPHDAARGFPLAVPAVRALTRLDLSAAVTFFVGENGSGKSTLLEAIALKAGLPTIGSDEVELDSSLAAQRELAELLRLSWSFRQRRGFFLRAEDFFGFLKSRARLEARIRRERAEAAAGWAGSAPSDGVPPDSVHPDEAAAAELMAVFDSRSHGESFFDLFHERVRGDGLFLLDEPESPLSPRRQLALVALLCDAVLEGAQFVIATHSPILLALPGARIYSFDEAPVREVAFEELEHVSLTRDFLNDPQRYLRHLL